MNAATLTSSVFGTQATLQNVSTNVPVAPEAVKIHPTIAHKRPKSLSVPDLLQLSRQSPFKQPSHFIELEDGLPQSVPDVELDVRRASSLIEEDAEPVTKRFSMEYELGRGSYGTVYCATDTKTGRQVAIKEIRKIEGCSKVSTCKLQNEIDVLKSLVGCSSVVQLYGSYKEGEKMYIVTELCQGNDLESFLKTNGPLSERQMAYVAYEALRMLSACHRQGIIHGDVKASNFVIQNLVGYTMFKQGNMLPSGWLKAIDFGTSQFSGRGRCSKKVGTPTHRAPEVIAGNYHTEADIWSLGVMLFRLLAGELPFWDEYQESQLKTEQEVNIGVLRNEIDFNTEPWCNVSPECVDFIQSLLDKSYMTRLTAESAMNHPFIIRHLNKKQRLGLGMFESVVFPSVDAVYAA